jgi:SAM-dependent methyltransferase
MSSRSQLGPLTERRRPTLVGRDYPPIGAAIEPIAEQLVDSASLRAGDSVLDVASGTGNVAIVAARRGCVVCAVDDLEALLEHGRERAATEGLHVAFTAGDAMQLPYGDASFRHRSAEEFADFFMTYYGPTERAAAALDEGGRVAMRVDLAALALTASRLPAGGPVAIDATYLETIAVRA